MQKRRRAEHDRLGLSVAAAARKYGIPRTTYRRWLAGEALPTAYNINPKEEDEMALTATRLTEEALDHWGLATDPFAPPAGAAEVVVIPSQEQAVRKIVRAGMTGGWMVLTGEVGAGKSIVVQLAQRRLEQERSIILARPETVLSSTLAAGSLVRALLKAISPEASYPPSLDRAVWRLVESLHGVRFDGAQVVLLIDEAHVLTDAALLVLKRLHEVGEETRPLISIMLVGQPSLARRLRSNWELREVGQRVVLHELPALTRSVRDYVRQRIAAAQKNGHTPDIFEESALKAIIKRCRTPLEVNNLAAIAMQIGYEDGEQQKISKELLGQITAASERGIA